MLLRLALIALVVLTSLSLGMARGQLRAGSDIVLCGGAPVVMDPADPQGHLRYCPDMALGFLATLDAPPLAVALPEGRGRGVAMPDRPRPARVGAPVPQARGPPLPHAA